ncbi:MAG TPA: dihydropteroate synthase [Candidatus Sulfotelmatobacter sp.]|jgi:dihydropteroate synthase|nr:dihydropteroate synthase [Candidatus Sulfotelmatobacter sp.]
MKQGKTLVMGILNVTPDSFSDGGNYLNPEKAVKHAKQMFSEGADIIDIGGESTRPGSAYVSEKEELRRIIPIITLVKKHLGKKIKLSVDTWKAAVANEALTAGADIINSLGGFSFDAKLAQVVASYHCPIVIYHIKGKPRTMQKGKIMYSNVSEEIRNFFEEQIAFGEKNAVKREQFILDPGIGFGKTVKQNIEILKNIDTFKKCNLPILIGVSRKSHLGMILKESLNLETKPTERIEASLAETAFAVYNGATIVRTHDVLPTKKLLAVVERFM